MDQMMESGESDHGATERQPVAAGQPSAAQKPSTFSRSIKVEKKNDFISKTSRFHREQKRQRRTCGGTRKDFLTQNISKDPIIMGWRSPALTFVYFVLSH